MAPSLSLYSRQPIANLAALIVSLQISEVNSEVGFEEPGFAGDWGCLGGDFGDGSFGGVGQSRKAEISNNIGTSGS